ncbi:MAG: zinc ABC transporter substrate-binding protein [Minwuiales bacterium]|nr:zinc ABC transporter substrate-binding protein [Minwuiales bacterium]
MIDQFVRRARNTVCVVAIAAAFMVPAGAVAAPKVVVTLLPIHSLVASVMQGVAEPGLLVKGAASPHAYALRPSDARMVAGADLIVWVGPDLESFFGKTVESLGAGKRVLELGHDAGLKILPVREGGDWEVHDHGHDDHGDDDHGHGHEAGDLHVWLDPGNARKIVAYTVKVLSEVDPDNAARYAENGARTAARLDGLDTELGQALAPVRGRPYVVFHDAYQYFERHYRLNALGSVTASPDRTPGARRLAQIRGKLTRLDAACVFSEPQFRPAIVDTLIEGTDVKTGVLDPLGHDLTAGPDAYFALMRRLADSLRTCLAPAS